MSPTLGRIMASIADMLEPGSHSESEVNTIAIGCLCAEIDSSNKSIDSLRSEIVELRKRLDMVVQP